MENDKPQQLLQKDDSNHNLQHQHHLEEEEDEVQEEKQQQNQEHQEAEDGKQQQQQQQQQQQHQQHQGQQNHYQQEEEKVEDKQNHTVSQYPLSKGTKPSRTIPKAQSSSDHSPIDSPLSSDNSSLSHGFSPPPEASQPSEASSKPPAVASQSPDSNPKPPAVEVSRLEFSSRNQSAGPTATAVEVEEQRQKLGSGSGKRLRPHLSILRRTKRDKMVKRALLGFRISGFVFCLISFCVLAVDKDKGWALDSFYRYKEFRFCMAVNVIGFVYCGIQGYDLAYKLTSRKQKLWSRFRCYLDFVLDQVLAYLLISASSSVAVRVDVWQSNWGKDKFPEMARASMALSLVAFIALALSSLISGYTLSTYG